MKPVGVHGCTQSPKTALVFYQNQQSLLLWRKYAYLSVLAATGYLSVPVTGLMDSLEGDNS